MPKVTYKKKVIDPTTGNETYVSTLVNISPRDPYNSIEFHKIAEALRIQRTDRLNYHVSGKVAVVYNYIANLIKSNDVTEITDAVKSFQKKTGNDHLQGKDLVAEMYRTVRLDMDKKKAKKKTDTKDEVHKELAKKLRAKKDRADELRESSEKVSKRKAEEDNLLNESTKRLQSEFKESVSKTVDTSKIETKHLESTSEEVL